MSIMKRKCNSVSWLTLSLSFSFHHLSTTTTTTSATMTPNETQKSKTIIVKWKEKKNWKRRTRKSFSNDYLQTMGDWHGFIIYRLRKIVIFSYLVHTKLPICDLICVPACRCCSTTNCWHSHSQTAHMQPMESYALDLFELKASFDSWRFTTR